MPTPETRPAGTIGVLGAGTMGAGIAQLAARSGARTLLHDPVAEALRKGESRAREGLQKEASKGRLSPEQADAAVERLRPAEDLEAMAECDLVIEAAPERIELKHDLYRRLEQIVGERCVLASNTSSLPITEIAAAVARPERVVGMHFFNPAPVMRLLEVIAGELSDERSLTLARETGKAMGKEAIRAADGPGFIVNRCNRPFGLEALRLLGEQVADVPSIDRIVRVGGGYRMGPFELSDLVGVDTGFDVSLSFYELSFGEPRWRPSPIQAQRVAAGLHGRKSGRGYYDYANDPYRPPDPDPPAQTGDAIVIGEGPVAQALRQRASGRGGPTIEVAGLGGEVSGEPFYALTPLALVETTGPAGDEAFAALGLHTARIRETPGGVLGRIACQLVNESAFALEAGIGEAEDIDKGMLLGLNHPRGPLAWGDELGLRNVLDLLDALYDEYREERYRAAPLLRRLVRTGQLGRTSGQGFFSYDTAP